MVRAVESVLDALEELVELYLRAGEESVKMDCRRGYAWLVDINIPSKMVGTPQDAAMWIARDWRLSRNIRR